MTALVWLRSSFGFTLFRPRSIFFAFSFSVCVLGYMAWHDPEIWQEYRAVCVFSAGAAALYWLHLAVAFSRELRSRGELDIYTGTSHLFRVIRRFGFSSEAAAIHIRLWLEPAAVLLVSGLLRYAGDERHLSTWLVIVAACMFCKEALNVWAQIRVNKIAHDMAALTAGRSEADAPTTEAPQATRVAGQRMKRNAAATDEEARVSRFAEVLGITPPYGLEEAEANYHALVRRDHPDANDNSPESTRRTAELNEAVEFFRKKYGG